jgi:hypothetical protein
VSESEAVSEALCNNIHYLICPMKYSTFFLFFVFGLLAFAQAAPGDAKPSPAKGKPKPKPKPKPKHHNIISMAPSVTSSMEPNSNIVSLDTISMTSSESNGVTSGNMDHVENAGVLAVMLGVVVACVVAIVAVLRAPVATHEPLSQTSDHASV